MPLNQRAVIVGVSLGIMFLIFELVRKRKLREEYSWLWILCGFGLIALAFTPFEALMVVAQTVGSEKPTAAIFFIGFVFVTLLCLQFSVKLSRMTEHVKDLAQQIALLEARQREDERQER